MTGFGSRPGCGARRSPLRGIAEYAMGCNTSAGWAADEDGVVRSAFTDFLPSAEVERVEPNESIADVEFGMEKLAELAASGPDAVVNALKDLPPLYETWIAQQEGAIDAIAGAPRQATAKRLVASARRARDRVHLRHRTLAFGRACASRLPRDERGSRACCAATRGDAQRRRSGGTAQPEMAAVSARFHLAQSVGLAGPASRRP